MILDNLQIQIAYGVVCVRPSQLQLANLMMPLEVSAFAEELDLFLKRELQLVKDFRKSCYLMACRAYRCLWASM